MNDRRMAVTLPATLFAVIGFFSLYFSMFWILVAEDTTDKPEALGCRLAGITVFAIGVWKLPLPPFSNVYLGFHSIAGSLRRTPTKRTVLAPVDPHDVWGLLAIRNSQWHHRAVEFRD